MIIGINGRVGAGKDTVGMIMQALTMGVGSRWATLPVEYAAAYAGRPNLKGGWEIKKFAGKLKQIASLLTGIPVEKFEDQEFKKTALPSDWDLFEVAYHDADEGRGNIAKFHEREKAKEFIEQYIDSDTGTPPITGQAMSVRSFLQKLGTEAIRDNIHPNAWVNALFADYKIQGMTPGWVPTYNNPDNHNLDEMAEPIHPNWIITDCRFPNEADAIRQRQGYVIRVSRPGEENLADLHPSETSLDNYDFDEVIVNDGTIDDLAVKVRELLTKMKIIQ